MKASDWFKKEIEKLNKDIDSLTYKYVLEFSENVYEILERKGIKNKNKYLAEKLNCSPAYITKIFNGNANFTIKKMIEIAAALEFDLEINLRPKLKSVVGSLNGNFRIEGGLKRENSIIL